MFKPIAVLAGVAIAASVFADQPVRTPEDAPLRGPDVTPDETARPAPPHRFQRGATGRGADFPRGPMFRAMHEAFSKLTSPDAPEELRLSEEQSQELADLRAEMRTKFESGERPMREHRPMAEAMDILNDEQKAFIKETVRETVQAMRGEGRRGQFQRGPRGRHDDEGRRGVREMRGQRGDVSPEQREMMKQFRQLSPEAKQRVREFIQQEYELQQQRDEASNATP